MDAYRCSENPVNRVAALAISQQRKKNPAVLSS